MSIYCPYCGKELPDGSAFCIQCGKKIPNLDSAGEVEPVNVHEQNAPVEIEPPTEECQTVEPSSGSNPGSGTNGFDVTKKGKSIASFVLGLIGVILFGSWFSFVLGIIGFFIGASAYKHSQGIKGLIIAGMILSVIAVISRFVMVLLSKAYGFSLLI